jgi:hypothetical protein
VAEAVSPQHAQSMNGFKKGDPLGTRNRLYTACGRCWTTSRPLSQGRAAILIVAPPFKGGRNRRFLLSADGGIGRPRNKCSQARPVCIRAPKKCLERQDKRPEKERGS